MAANAVQVPFPMDKTMLHLLIADLVPTDDLDLITWKAVCEALAMRMTFRTDTFQVH